MNISKIFYFELLYSIIFCYSGNYENLYRWLINNGAYINRKLIPIENSIYNRYIITTEKINKKEEILFIPEKVTISTLNGKVFEKCKKDLSEYYSFAPRDELSSFYFDCLVYFLTLDIDNNQSFFKYYYNYLL